MQVIYLNRDLQSGPLNGVLSAKDGPIVPFSQTDTTTFARLQGEFVQFVELTNEQLETLKLFEDGSYAENIQRRKDEFYQAGYKQGKKDVIRLFQIASPETLSACVQLQATVDPITAIQEACKINPQMIELVQRAITCLERDDEQEPLDIGLTVAYILSRAIPSAKMTDVPKSGNSEESK